MTIGTSSLSDLTKKASTIGLMTRATHLHKEPEQCLDQRTNGVLIRLIADSGWPRNEKIFIFCSDLVKSDRLLVKCFVINGTNVHLLAPGAIRCALGAAIRHASAIELDEAQRKKLVRLAQSNTAEVRLARRTGIAIIARWPVSLAAPARIRL